MGVFILGGIVNRLIILIALLLSPVVQANEYKLFELDEFNMELYSLADHRTLDLPFKDQGADGESWTQGYAANFNIDLFKWANYGLYWQNKVHAESTEAQVRQVGWKYEIGVDLNQKVQLYWLHHSQHLLDGKNPNGKYPLDNFYGIRTVFYKRDK